MFPICKTCALHVEAGKRYLDEHLRAKFYGNELYIIPKILDDSKIDVILKRFEKMVEEFENELHY